MAEISIRRHQPIFDPSKFPYDIHIIGCGATGSRIYMALVELGCMRIHCYDFDVVEPHNLANQAFLHEHIGQQKVEGCRDLYTKKIGNPPPATMHYHDMKVSKDTLTRGDLSGTVFLLVDTVEARKDIYNTLIKDNLMIDHVIETRMASTHGNVFSFDPSDVEESKKWYDSLPTDDTRELSACGQPISVGTTASVIANLAVWRYMLLHSNPAGADKRLDIYLKPFMSHTA